MNRDEYVAGIRERNRILRGWQEGRRRSNGELPANVALREAQERRAAQQTEDSAKSRQEAAIAAQHRRNQELRHWQGLRTQALDAANAAEGEAVRALEAGDLDGAAAARGRAQALRSLEPLVDDQIRRRFSAPFINRTAFQV